MVTDLVIALERSLEEYWHFLKRRRMAVVRGMLGSAGCPLVREWLHFYTSPGSGHGSSGRTSSDVETSGFKS